ncbi:chloride channel protein [Thermodesulforhabdus norvegica]|uniref:Chloride channel protein, CIC family n=1 Tax=Thermodesulforhabdus norvegica TaxID=39841 RepID=A0A1I4TFU3_9BACT|nr:chloride channel protein [Thermodesulforhabdus norvegica]SFM75410.1 chloride channel protein, CIC family [Thermodesulforhabdus norvegica]
MSVIVAIARKLESRRSVKWIVYGSIIGVVSALGAAFFFVCLEWGKFFCFEYLAGFKLTHPAGEHLVRREVSTEFRRWLMVLLPAIGGLISGFIVYTWAPEAEGHGTDAMIDAFHNRKGLVRWRVPYVKSLASIVTLATGGSAGREGPIAQIGSGFGSWLAQVLNLSARDRRIMLLAGCAGGLGAIFRAPIGGALTAVEVLYREDFESEAIVPCVISSVVAYSLFTTAFGFQPIFDIPHVRFTNPKELLLYAMLALICVPFGFLYVKFFYGLRDRFFRPLPLKNHFKPALGGLVVGLIGLGFPQVLSGGYGTIQQALYGQLSVSLMFALAFMKIMATSFTISSGGSGGVFGPSLYIGAMIGGAVGHLGNILFPGVVSHPGAFALVGMGAFFAGVAKAPLGALMMVSEMTQGYGLLVPLIFASTITMILSQKWHLYEKQVLNKFASPAHRAEAVVNVLQGLTVRDVCPTDRSVTMLPIDMTLGELKRLMARTDETFFPVVDQSFRLKGILALPRIRGVVLEEDVLSDLVVVGELMSDPVFIRWDESLDQVLIKFLKSGYYRLPVINDAGEFEGMFGLDELVSAYHSEITRLKGEE